MPRKVREDSEAIVAIFKKYKEDLFDETTREIPKRSEPIWSTIADVFSRAKIRIDSKYAHVLLSQNRYELWSHVGITQGTIDLDESSASNESSNEEDNKREFKITFAPQEYSSLEKPTQYAQRDERGFYLRDHTVLTPGEWTHVIYDKIHSVTRLPCNISFKRNKICPQGVTYLHVVGKCSDCNSTFNGKIIDPPNLELNYPVIMDCTYVGNFNSCEATSKKRITGLRKQKFSYKMIKRNKSASSIRKCFAKNYMASGEREPSHCPSGNALRVLKSKTQKKKISR